MTFEKIKGIVASLSVVVIYGLWFWMGYQAGGSSARLELAEARAAWQKERTAAKADALTESEAQRAREQSLTEKLALAAKEHDDAKTLLSAAIADRSRIDRQLRDARSAITAALNRKEWAAAAPCFRAADTTLSALGGCTGEYRDMAYRYGECLAGMQMIEKTWNAARETCR
ncbi:MAG: hypothetical protein FWG52_05550 [Proteobacteria bacterium]|nr:hypothetical protein [Pseudomonadota bacterium]